MVQKREQYNTQNLPDIITFERLQQDFGYFEMYIATGEVLVDTDKNAGSGDALFC